MFGMKIKDVLLINSNYVLWKLKRILNKKEKLYNWNFVLNVKKEKD